MLKNLCAHHPVLPACVLALQLSLVAIPVAAQPLPPQIEGQWTWQERRITHPFMLTKLQAGEGTFTANLTWVTIDPKCALRDAAVSGQMTEGTITFASRTKCNIPFTVDLKRTPSGWVGKAVAKAVVDLELDLKAQ